MSKYGTLSEALRKWDSNETVWTIEMGGLGPSYEQAIQIGIFELIKMLRNHTMPDDQTALQELFDDHLSMLCKTVPALEGLSGAMAGSIKHVAYRYLTKGYSECIESVEQDRRILCQKNFPQGPA